MPFDIKLKYDANKGIDFDISDKGDFVFTDGVESQVIMQTFMAHRLTSSQQPNIFKQGGWWGNPQFYPLNSPVGTRFIKLLETYRGTPLETNNLIVELQTSLKKIDGYKSSNITIEPSEINPNIYIINIELILTSGTQRFDFVV